MYTFSSKLKTFSYILMLVGVLGIGYGFFAAPKTVQDVETILKEEESHHEGGHEAAAAHHDAKAESHHATTNHEEVAKTAIDSKVVHTEAVSSVKDTVAETTSTNHEEHMSTTVGVKNEEANKHVEHKEHVEHVFHQLQNKPWAALYVACIFFMLISLGALAFYGTSRLVSSIV